MSIKVPKGKRDPQGKREAILEAAKTVFINKGYTKTKMDDFVALSGVSKGGVYWHFKGKDEIFLALLSAWVDELYMYYQEIRTSDQLLENKLRTLFERAFPDHGRHILSIGTEFWLANLHNPEVLAILQEIYGRYQGVFHALLFDGIVRNECKAMNIEEMTLSLMGLIEGIYSYQILMGHERDHNRALKAGLEIFLRGIRFESEED